MTPDEEALAAIEVDPETGIPTDALEHVDLTREVDPGLEGASDEPDYGGDHIERFTQADEDAADVDDSSDDPDEDPDPTDDPDFVPADTEDEDI
jgi:hypothetical protein